MELYEKHSDYRWFDYYGFLFDFTSLFTADCSTINQRGSLSNTDWLTKIVEHLTNLREHIYYEALEKAQKFHHSFWELTFGSEYDKDAIWRQLYIFSSKNTHPTSEDVTSFQQQIYQLRTKTFKFKGKHYPEKQDDPND